MSSSSEPNERRLRCEPLNLEDIDMEDEVEKSLSKCRIPKIPIHKLYKKQGFFTSSTIKIIKEQISLPIEQETVPLFSRKFINKHKNSYNFLHVASIQVLAAPLHRLGIENAILLSVRDRREIDFLQSVRGMAETSLCEGAVYLECFPNCTVPLRKPLVLEVRKQGYDMRPGTHAIAMEFRVCCRLMRSEEDDARAHKDSGREETLHFQIIRDGSDRRIVPWKTRWDYISDPGPSKMSSSSTQNEMRLRCEPLNLEDIDMEDEVEKYLSKGRIPKIPIYKLYKKQGFFTSSTVKIIKEQISLPIEQETVPLFNRMFINKHKNSYDFLHVASIQVLAAPLHRLGIANAILLSVRDQREIDFPESVRGMAETSLCEGPVYLECFPNCTVPLRKPLVLEVRKQGYDMRPGSHAIAMEFRVCCRLMRSEEDDARALKDSGREETLHFQVISNRSGWSIVPWKTRWDRIV